MTNNVKRLLKQLNTACIDQYGVSYVDLPDLVFLSDYTWDGMTQTDINDSASDILTELIDLGELPE
jgi:hypothetical protein